MHHQEIYNNECKECNPSKNRTDWSYNTQSFMCQPNLRYREYNVRIMEHQYYNETLKIL